jgi:integrase
MDETLLRNHLLPIFAAYRINRIKRADIIKMHHAAKAKGFADGTCNRWLILMRFIFNCAIRWELLPAGANPCNGVELFADNGARERYLTEQEVARLFAVLDSNPNQQLAKIVKLLLFTGARKREILDAMWENIDMNKRLLKVPISKSGKPRFIPLSDAACDILSSLPRKANVPYVFFNPKTLKPLVSVFCAWNTVRKAAGIPELRMHDLRHSFASFLVNSGRSLYEVQRLLGHYDPKVTMRYAHLSQASLLDAANVVGNLGGANM